MVAMDNKDKNKTLGRFFPSSIFVGEGGPGFFGVPRLATCSWCTLHSFSKEELTDGKPSDDKKVS
jgi:hypothetical protein